MPESDARDRPPVDFVGDPDAECVLVQCDEGAVIHSVDPDGDEEFVVSDTVVEVVR